MRLDSNFDANKMCNSVDCLTNSGFAMTDSYFQ